MGAASFRSSSKLLTPLVFYDILKKEGIPLPVSEHKFHPIRRWRFDYAFIEERVALEIEGGIWVYGRHNHATGFVKDMQKYNEAAKLGWRVIKAQPRELLTRDFIQFIKETLQYGK